MLSRREFLAFGAVAAGAASSAGRVQAADASLQPPTSGGGGFAGLTSMRAQARSITADERRLRLEKARRLMSEQQMDGLLLTGGTSLVYFSNIRWGISERLFAMVVPVKGDPFYVCPAFEEDRAHEQIAGGPLAAAPDVRTWEEH